MIHASLLLRRAFLLDIITSGMMALLLTFGAAELAPLLNLPEELLRETGLVLIAYTALVGWLATRQSMPKALVLIVIAINAAWTVAHRAVILQRRDAEPAGPGLYRWTGHRARRARRTAIYRIAQKQRRDGGGLEHDRF
jgi:uncharacterized protein YjeT (DUF2065 family)